MSIRLGNNIVAGGGFSIDATPTSSSNNPVSSGGTYTALSGKANTTLDNLTSAGQEVCANMAMPSDRFVNLTLGSSGSSYTAPADGCFAYYHTGISTSVFYTNNRLYGYSARGDSGIVNYNTIQVRKGVTVTLAYNGSGGEQFLRFVYSVGSSL